MNSRSAQPGNAVDPWVAVQLGVIIYLEGGYQPCQLDPTVL